MEGGRRKRKPLADCTNTTTTAAAAAANKRKALSDCTNTTTANKKPSLASALKKILANDAGINSNSKPSLNVVESATVVSPSSSVAVASTPTKTGMVSGTGDREVVEPCSVYSRRSTADGRKSKGKEVVGSSPISIDAGINSNSKPGLNVVESATLVSPSSSVAVASTPTKTCMVSGIGDCEFVELCSIYSRRRTADRRKSKGKEVVGSSPITIDAIGDSNKEDKVTGPPKSSTVHHKKKKKDEPVHAMPQDFIEKQRAYFAEVDAFELPEEEVEMTDQLE